jgi:multidrug transporter EmrE-like cation transporter
MKIQAIVYIVVAVMMGVVGQIFVKAALNIQGGVDFSRGVVLGYLKLLRSYHFVLGTVIYTLSIFPWIYGLSKVDLSYAYPFLAMSYVLVILASWFIFSENIPVLRWLGVIVICMGVLMVARS